MIDLLKTFHKQLETSKTEDPILFYLENVVNTRGIINLTIKSILKSELPNSGLVVDEHLTEECQPNLTFLVCLKKAKP